MKDKKVVEETKEQVASAQPTMIKIMLGDAVQDEFDMRPRARSRVKKTQEEATPQVVVEISKDRQLDKKCHGIVDEVKQPEIVQPDQEEDIAQPQIGVMNYQEDDPKTTKMK